MDSDDVTFLIVDDDDVSVMAVERAIRRLRLTNPIERARDGAEALDRLRAEGADRVRRPYIILLDLHMPRMTGLEFLGHVRRDALLRGSVVFMMTTSDAPSDIARAYDKMVAGYIIKDDAVGSMKSAMEMLGAYISIVRLPAAEAATLKHETRGQIDAHIAAG